MRFTNRLTLLQLFLFIVACAYGQDVHYNYDRGTNFSSYKTYQWVDLDARVPDQLIDRDIKRAVDEQLAQKGLTKVEKNADLYVGYQAVIKLEKASTYPAGVRAADLGDGDGADWIPIPSRARLRLFPSESCWLASMTRLRSS